MTKLIRLAFLILGVARLTHSAEPNTAIAFNKKCFDVSPASSIAPYSLQIGLKLPIDPACFDLIHGKFTSEAIFEVYSTEAVDAKMKALQGDIDDLSRKAVEAINNLWLTTLSKPLKSTPW